MNNRNIKLAFIDGTCSLFALYFSFLIRYEFQVPNYYIDVFISWFPWFVLIQIVVFYFTGYMHAFGVTPHF